MQLLAVTNNKISSTVISQRRNGGDLPLALPSFLSFFPYLLPPLSTRQTPQAELLNAFISNRLTNC